MSFKIFKYRLNPFIENTRSWVLIQEFQGFKAPYWMCPREWVIRCDNWLGNGLNAVKCVKVPSPKHPQTRADEEHPPWMMIMIPTGNGSSTKRRTNVQCCEPGLRNLETSSVWTANFGNLDINQRVLILVPICPFLFLCFLVMFSPPHLAKNNLGPLGRLGLPAVSGRCCDLRAAP